MIIYKKKIGYMCEVRGVRYDIVDAQPQDNTWSLSKGKKKFKLTRPGPHYVVKDIKGKELARTLSVEFYKTRTKRKRWGALDFSKKAA